jgi:antitoxin HicB
MTETEISTEIERLRALPYTYATRKEDDGSWFAQIKELRGCMTVGDSREEALEMLDDALVTWLEAAIEDGVVIPEPQQEHAFSGRFVIRVAHTMHEALSERAEREGISLNSLVVTALASYLGSQSVTGTSYAAALAKLFDLQLLGDLANLSSLTSGTPATEVAQVQHALAICSQAA